MAYDSLRTGPFGGNVRGEVARHGTGSGASVHRSFGEEPCEPCRFADMDRRRAGRLRARRGFTITLAEALAELGLPPDRTDMVPDQVNGP